jgi:membrane protein DedA with SNARE-associated domain
MTNLRLTMHRFAIWTLLFCLCWVAWCLFSILELGPEIAKHQLNGHRVIIAWLLCVIPLFIFAIVAVRGLPPRR